MIEYLFIMVLSPALVIWIGNIILCHIWAGKKGLDSTHWMLMAIVLGLIATLLLWGAHPKVTKGQDKKAQ